MASTDFPDVCQTVTSRLYCFLSAPQMAIALIFKLAAVTAGKKNRRLNCEAKSERYKQTKSESAYHFLLVIAILVHITKTTREEAVFSNFFNTKMMNRLYLSSTKSYMNDKFLVFF